MKAKHDVCRTEDSGAQFKLTFTSGQEVEVKSQSGHLKVLASKCALLWFSISERPWKDSMHIRHENLLVLRLGEPTGDGEAGASLLSWQKTKKKNTVKEEMYSVYTDLYMSTQLFVSRSYLHLLQNTIRQYWSEVELVTFQALWPRNLYSLSRTALTITAKTAVLWHYRLLRHHKGHQRVLS